MKLKNRSDCLELQDTSLPGEMGGSLCRPMPCTHQLFPHTFRNEVPLPSVQTQTCHSSLIFTMKPFRICRDYTKLGDDAHDAVGACAPNICDEAPRKREQRPTRQGTSSWHSRNATLALCSQTCLSQLVSRAARSHFPTFNGCKEFDCSSV
jgi:hypothetical protein